MAGCATAVAMPAAITPASGSVAHTSSTSAVCAPTDDFTALFLSKIQRLVTSTDTGDVATRQRFHWPSVTARSVTYVTDDSVCSSAEAVYTPAAGLNPPPTPSGQVYVYKIGFVYFIFDRAQSVGEWTVAMTLDRKFNVLVKSKI
jgi:hypothetical protein